MGSESKESKRQRSFREILKEKLSGSAVSQSEAATKFEEGKQEFIQGVVKTAEGKSQSWMEERWKQLNVAWKKTHHSSVSLFCDRGKHQKCTLDPDCLCECHSKETAMVV